MSPIKLANIEVEYIDHCGSDLSVVNAARVSFDKESALVDGKLSKSDEKLINYLAKHKHLSPFNHTFISLRVKVPIFIARQLVKHEYMPWNEVSRRYVDSEPEFYFPKIWRKRAEDKKQGSLEEPIQKNILASQLAEETVAQVLQLYRDMLEEGVCPEQARIILPQNTMTELYWSGTLGASAKMLKLRLASDTQKETRIVAEKVKAIVEPLFPVALPALLEHYD